MNYDLIANVVFLVVGSDQQSNNRDICGAVLAKLAQHNKSRPTSRGRLLRIGKLLLLSS
jgi:hypothetical protein